MLQSAQTLTLIPYIRRLIVTGLDTKDNYELFFGDKWVDGITVLHETETFNYLFAIKSDTWLRVRDAYDLEDGQEVPFLSPPHQTREEDVRVAELSWSDWLAAQDWIFEL